MNKEILHRAADLGGLLFMHHVAVTQPETYNGDFSSLNRQVTLAFHVLGVTPPTCQPHELLEVGLGVLKVQLPDAAAFIDIGKMLAGLAMLTHNKADAVALELIFDALPASAGKVMRYSAVPDWIQHLRSLPPKETAEEVHRLIDESTFSHRRIPNAAEVSLNAYDLFISHASDDKDAVARPLYDALTAQGISVWFDEATLKLGDSLRRKIDDGLAKCRYGVVILSPRFLCKQWPQRELDGLVARETASGEKAILPIWHDLNQTTLMQYSPTLADRLAARSSEGIPSIVEKITQVLRR